MAVDAEARIRRERDAEIDARIKRRVEAQLGAERAASRRDRVIKIGIGLVVSGSLLAVCVSSVRHSESISSTGHTATQCTPPQMEAVGAIQRLIDGLDIRAAVGCTDDLLVVATSDRTCSVAALTSMRDALKPVYDLAKEFRGMRCVDDGRLGITIELR